MAPNDIKLISIDERDINSGRVMEMTPVTTLTKKMHITVPMNYHALIISDGKVVATVKSCLKKKLKRVLGPNFVGKAFSVLYVSNRSFTAMSWGIGSLPITYPFLDNASVNVGASGTLVPLLVNEYAFYKEFDMENGMLSLTECASMITSAFRKCASAVLVEMFNEATQPIFETEFLVSEMDRRINERYCGMELENVIRGIVFQVATVSGIRVNEEDKMSVIARYGSRKKK